MKESIKFPVVTDDGMDALAELTYDPEMETYEMALGDEGLFVGDWPYLVTVLKRALELWG